MREEVRHRREGSVSLEIARGSRAYNGSMSDFIFIAATIVFFAVCALYVRWCDAIIGPDDFPAPRDDGDVALGESNAVLVATAGDVVTS
jgi:hypothetical protein